MTEDIHEKIGKLTGTLKTFMTEIRDDRKEQREVNSELFKDIKESNKEMTQSISEAMVRPCKKEEELSRINKGLEANMQQTARIHEAAKPVIGEFEQRQNRKLRKLTERSEVRILIIGTFLIWFGSQITKGVAWLYHHVVK